MGNKGTDTLAFVFFLCVRSTYRAFFTKTKRQFWTQVIVFGAILFYVMFVNELIPGSTTYYDYKYTKKIVGKGIKLDHIYSNESYVELLLPDGYAMYVYGIDDEAAIHFMDPNEKFFSDFPSREPFHYNWTCKNWTKCPIDTADFRFRKSALGEYNKRPNYPSTKIGNAKKFILGMLNEKGNYYAYRAYMNGENWVGDITFYVLSPKRKKLIVIYMNS